MADDEYYQYGETKGGYFVEMNLREMLGIGPMPEIEFDFDAEDDAWVEWCIQRHFNGGGDPRGTEYCGFCETPYPDPSLDNLKCAECWKPP